MGSLLPCAAPHTHHLFSPTAVTTSHTTRAPFIPPCFHPSCAEDTVYKDVKRICDTVLGVQSQLLVAPNIKLGQGQGGQMGKKMAGVALKVSFERVLLGPEVVVVGRMLLRSPLQRSRWLGTELTVEILAHEVRSAAFGP